MRRLGKLMSVFVTVAMIAACTTYPVQDNATSGKTARAAGKVVWKNGAGQKIAIHTVDTFDASCPPQNPGGTSNFTLNAGESHELKLVEGQAFCWTWRNDSDGSTDQINFCTAVAGDVINVNASTAPASQCKEKLRQ